MVTYNGNISFLLYSLLYLIAKYMISLKIWTITQIVLFIKKEQNLLTFY